MPYLPSCPILTPGQEVKRAWTGVLNQVPILCKETEWCAGGKSEEGPKPELAWPEWGSKYYSNLVPSDLV